MAKDREHSTPHVSGLDHILWPQALVGQLPSRDSNLGIVAKEKSAERVSVAKRSDQLWRDIKAVIDALWIISSIVLLVMAAIFRISWPKDK